MSKGMMILQQASFEASIFFNRTIRHPEYNWKGVITGACLLGIKVRHGDYARVTPGGFSSGCDYGVPNPTPEIEKQKYKARMVK